MSTAMRALKTAQQIQKLRRQRPEAGRRMQVSRRGMHGMRNRGSWWGTRLRMSVPVSADVSGGLASIAFSLLVVNGCNDVRSGINAGPSS
jgi:hypothetical protein